MGILTLPAEFRDRITNIHGEAGSRWLAGIPELLQQICRRWHIRIDAPFERLSYNFVAAATRSDGLPVVLKAGVPSQELISEAAALQCYAGRGAVSLLESDAELGVMLMERINPGRTLLELSNGQYEEWVVSAAAQAIRALRCPPPAEHSFRSVSDWAKGFERLREQFDGGTGPFPTILVEEAETLYKDLLASPGEAVLLHGDLHHENILESRQGGYVAIDPKGIIGEAEYEAGAFLRNPMPDILNGDGFVRFHTRRIQQLADELELDRRRVRDWAVAQAVLSAWWTYEDREEGWEPTIRLAQLLSRIYVNRKTGVADVDIY